MTKIPHIFLSRRLCLCLVYVQGGPNNVHDDLRPRKSISMLCSVARVDANLWHIVTIPTIIPV